MHLHCPVIFNAQGLLGLPCTSPSAVYGTPEMASEIQGLAMCEDQRLPGLLVMTGHQDGILAYGATAPETGGLVVETLALALQQSR